MSAKTILILISLGFLVAAIAYPATIAIFLGIWLFAYIVR